MSEPYLTAVEIARLLGYTPRRVRQLFKTRAFGKIISTENGAAASKSAVERYARRSLTIIRGGDAA
jgi:hypothetical protein